MQLPLHRNRPRCTRIPPFFESRTCHSAFFQWKIVRCLRARGIFPHFFTIALRHRHRVDAGLRKGGEGEDYDAILFKDGQAIVSLAKTRETLRGIILEAFTRLRSIIGGNSTVCNYCPLSVGIIDYSPRTTSLFVPRTCDVWHRFFFFFPVSDAIISRLLPRYNQY